MPAGETPPWPVITAPKDGTTVTVSNTKPGIVKLAGFAEDQVDGQVVQRSGDRLRWVATSGEERIEACRGSRWPPPGGGGIGQIVEPKDCSETEVELYIRQGETRTTWTISLWARDASGLETETVVSVEVRLATG